MKATFSVGFFKYMYHESTVRVKRRRYVCVSSWTAGYAAAGDPEHAAAGHSGGCGELRQDQGRVPPQLIIEFFG